jgi:hypothetical protein
VIHLHCKIIILFVKNASVDKNKSHAVPESGIGYWTVLDE